MPTIKRTQVEFEGRIEEREVIVEEERVQRWDAEAELEVVGVPTPRIDGAARVTGRARYTRDRFPADGLVGRMLRSPHPHARLVSIDVSEARALPGVWLVWHVDEPPPIARMGGRDLFARELAYQGAEVALVVADDARIAEDALAAITVEYEALPSVSDLDDASADGAPPALLGEDSNWVEPASAYTRGDVERGLAEADVTVDLTFTTPAAAHCCLETHGSAAAWEGDQVTIWHSTQAVHVTRRGLADALGVSLDKVRAICEYVGGGFGSKFGAENYSLLAALAAREAGRPVRVILDRKEEHLAGGYRPSSRQRVRLGARSDGVLTLIDQEAWVVTGAYGGGGPVIGGPAKDLYACENVRTVTRTIRTNRDNHRAFRAPGYVEGAVGLEGAMDALAAELGMDPLALRLANYAEESPSRGVPYTTKGLRQAYALGAERFGWADRQARKGDRGPWCTGFGMASQIWGGGGGPPAKAVVKLLPDGTAEVAVGVQDLGTGTKTVLAQVAAEELGLPMVDIRIVVGDSLLTPYGPGSGGSVTLASATPAVREACFDALRQIYDLAAYMLDVPQASAADFSVKQGRITYPPDPAKTLSFLEVAAKMGNYMIVGQGARGPNPDGKALNTFGAQFAQVAVNRETGQVRVERIVAAHEIGRVVNPLTAKSQVYGGVLMGLGFALTEERVLDGATGLQLTANLEDYRPPTLADMPEIEALFVDLPDPQANSVGSKGLGEPPIIPTAAAIANAVSDALGLRLTHLPLTPDRILGALASAEEVTP